MKRLVLTTSALMAASALTLAACGTDAAKDDGGAKGGTVLVGIVSSYTSSLANFGPSWEAGFRAGLKVLTKGTNEVDGTKIKVEVRDDAATAPKGVSAATELISNGAKFIIGTASSAVSVPIAELAAKNKVIFISGSTSAAEINGMSKYVFRSNGTGSYSLTKAAILSIQKSGAKSLAFVGQDYAYGQDSSKAFEREAKALGIKFTSVLLPTTTLDFTAGVAQLLKAKPDAIYSAWAGTGTPQFFAALTNQGAFDKSKIFTIAPGRPSWDAFADSVGPRLSDLTLITAYAEGALDNPVNTAMMDALKGDPTPIDFQQAEGYLAAQMLVHAIQAGGASGNADKYAEALSGWTVDAPVGPVTIRKEDHAVTVPEFAFKMVKDSNGKWKLEKTDEFSPDQVTPPVTRTIK